MARKASLQPSQAAINRVTARLLKTGPAVSVHAPTPIPKKKSSPKKRITRLPTLPPSPMAVDFRHIKPTWRAYIDYVSTAARDGDKDMQKYLAAYTRLTPKEQLAHTPETLCDLTGIKASDLFGTVCAQVWDSSRREASLLIALNHPRIIEKTAKFALSPKGVKDREMFHKGTGFLPTPKGAQISINNSPQMLQAGGSHGPIALPSMEQDMMEIEDAEFTDSLPVPLPLLAAPSVDSTQESQASDVPPFRHPR